MRISYKPLFSIECLHGYFADRVCRALTVGPTAAAKRLCDRYQLRFRPSAGGGTVYYEESASSRERLRTETTPLAFALTTTDWLFDIYTEGGDSDHATPDERLRYFSNRATAPGGEPRRVLLHPPGQALTPPPLRVRRSRFTHRFDQPVRRAVVQALDAGGESRWQATTPDAPVRDWPVDLSGQPCGRYQLTIDGRPAADFYLTDEPRMWGVIEIFPKELDDTPTFTVSFDSRETVWRYYIFEQPQAGSLDAGYEVVAVRKRPGSTNGASQGDIRFTRQAETVAVNGRPAVVFESRQTMPLAEVPSEDDYLVTFRPNGGGERGGRPVKLPFPQPMATTFDASTGAARLVSEIFVYL